MDRHRGQPDERRRQDDRADLADELWDTRHRAHHRRSEELHEALHRQVEPAHRARYGTGRRVLPREREIVRANAAIKRIGIVPRSEFLVSGSCAGFRFRVPGSWFTVRRAWSPEHELGTRNVDPGPTPGCYFVFVEVSHAAVFF